MAGQVETQPTERADSLSSLAESMSEEPALEETEESESEEEAEQTEEPEEQVEEPEEAEESAFTIKHDGKEVTLKQSELVELAQKGFDYQKKTMAVAEERKAIEPIKAKATEALQRHEEALNETLHRLNAFAQHVEAELGAPPDVSLATYDAGAYLAQKEMHQSRVDKLNRAYEQISYLSNQQNQLRQSQLMEQANETESYLVENLPGWREAPEKSLQELNAYIKGYGLSPESTKEAYVQKGLWEIAHKAREYDKLQEAKSKLTPKAQLPKVMKPSASNQPNATKRQEQLKRFDRSDKKNLSALASILD
jgi:hypothetical protein